MGLSTHLSPEALLFCHFARIGIVVLPLVVAVPCLLVVSPHHRQRLSSDCCCWSSRALEGQAVQLVPLWLGLLPCQNPYPMHCGRQCPCHRSASRQIVLRVQAYWHMLSPRSHGAVDNNVCGKLCRYTANIHSNSNSNSSYRSMNCSAPCAHKSPGYGNARKNSRL